MLDSADPLEGWANTDVLATFSGPASKDLYGKLYYHVKDVLRTFYRRMSSLECNIQMFSIDAQELRSHLQESSFARIDVSLKQTCKSLTKISRQSFVDTSQGFEHCRPSISWDKFSHQKFSTTFTKSSYQCSRNAHCAIYECSS